MNSRPKERHVPNWALPLRPLGRCIPLHVRRALRCAYRWWHAHKRNINTQAYWDQVYSTEDVPSPGHIRDYATLHRAILELVPPGSSVLDVGCGTGLLASKLLDKGCKVMGLDFSQRAVEICWSQGIQARQCEFPQIPGDVGVFDVAICSEVLEHLDKPKQTMRAIGGVVRSGGLVIVSVPGQTVIDTNLEHTHLFDRRDVLILMNIAVDSAQCTAVERSEGRGKGVSWLAWGQVRRA